MPALTEEAERQRPMALPGYREGVVPKLRSRDLRAGLDAI